ncbi:uncharacterized protein Z520_01731 [Fonsecaea multimorphosa CBS 102226]|uniref:F-box domain-containing protein n=1 Tax=Fonsecaea multimorphosa CBS 102226 TaxID=1442371 RepID=A0A0D2L2J7_9EURO|nr:uncharacterized protein Z520_01731 [Fonsecaea multimorphosa CBS 102226]KIY03264.1 hypothetical protein Z520_01731 [Fonsecaea multimorphosa CBS 102226]OAL30183.1 hypothetical protein AYO22_01699 [Fonsecaea multimorphosa]
MPKATVTKPAALREARPYPQKQPANRTRTNQAYKSAARGNKGENPQWFRFLDLPPEIRLQIYERFAVVDEIVLPINPRTDVLAAMSRTIQLEKRSKSVQDVKKTRRSLQGVCRRITKEWTPIFFSTTTIVVNPSQYTAKDFGDIFMKTMADNKLKCISRLMYIDLLDTQRTSLRTGQGLASFLEALHDHLPRLTSLTKITYSAVFKRMINIPPTYIAFDYLDITGKLKLLEQQALCSTGSSFLKDWQSQWEIRYWRKECKFLELVFRREQSHIARAVEERPADEGAWQLWNLEITPTGLVMTGPSVTRECSIAHTEAALTAKENNEPTSKT